MSETFWIWCRLEETYHAWHLAVERGNDLYFPVTGALLPQKKFAALPCIELYEPLTPTVKCKFCQGAHPATEKHFHWHQGKPVCNGCWDERLRVTE